MEIIWTQKSVQRLNEYIDYIALDDYLKAEKWAFELIQKTELLVNQPNFGRIVPEFHNQDLREIIFGNYRIIYRTSLAQQKVFILTIWHVRQLPPDFSELR